MYVAALLRMREALGSFSAWRLGNMIDAFREFPQRLKENAGRLKTKITTEFLFCH